MSTSTDLFLSTIDGSTKAIREKRYDLVQVFGNRLLSDLLIFQHDLTDEQASLISFSGLFIKRIGFDLSNLSLDSHDSAKLRQRAIDSIKKVRNLITENKNDFENCIIIYQKYEDTWVEEMNTVELATYLRNCSNDKSIYSWALEGIKELNQKEYSVYAYAISGISNELNRLSYMEKLSMRTEMLFITIRALEWLSTTINQAIQVIPERVLEKDRRKIFIKQYESKILNFTSRVSRVHDNWVNTDGNKIPKSILLPIFSI